MCFWFWFPAPRNSRMSRAPRTLKVQKEYIINFLEENKILLGGKINPIQIPVVNKKWEGLAYHLNQMGPSKTIKQWKDTISEMKTSVRRRARDVKYSHSGTGGGTGMKPLTDFEERLLALISKLTIDGAQLVEAGISPRPEQHIVWDEQPPLESNNSAVEQSTHDNIIIEEFIIEEHAPPNPSQLDKSILEEIRPKKTTGNRKQIIKKRPVRRNGNVIHAALDVHDKNLQALTTSNYSIAKSINNLAKAINNMARKIK